MSKVMAKTCDDYEPLFAEELAKYDQVKGAIANNVSSQSDTLSRLRDTHARSSPRTTSQVGGRRWRRTRRSCAAPSRTTVNSLPGSIVGSRSTRGSRRRRSSSGRTARGSRRTDARRRGIWKRAAPRAQQAAAMAELTPQPLPHNTAPPPTKPPRSAPSRRRRRPCRPQLQRQAALQRASSFGAAPQPPPGVHVPQYAAPAPPPGVPVRTPRTTPRGIPSHHRRTRDISTARRSPRNRRCRTARGRLSPRPRRKGHTCTRRPRPRHPAARRRRHGRVNCRRRGSTRRTGMKPRIKVLALVFPLANLPTMRLLARFNTLGVLCVPVMMPSPSPPPPPPASRRRWRPSSVWHAVGVSTSHSFARLIHYCIITSSAG